MQEEDLDCVKALISLDADVNLEDSMGKTPLDFVIIEMRTVYSPNNDIKMATLDHGSTIEESFTSKSCFITVLTIICIVELQFSEHYTSYHNSLRLKTYTGSIFFPSK